MIRFPSLDPDMMAPSKAVLLESLRIPADRASERHNEWAEAALRRYLELVRPAMVVQPVSVKEFRGIYKGEGRNESPAPLDKVFPRAFRLALFALTLGEELSGEIGRLFKKGLEVEAVFLDAAASRAAEAASEMGGQAWLEEIRCPDAESGRAFVLGYSPGYCGWHLSGQKMLLDRLGACRIGITLNGSFLMSPMKSVSGVWVVGGAEIFIDEDLYPFCAGCPAPTCRERQRRVLEWMSSNRSEQA
jgi:hypothetical protein